MIQTHPTRPVHDDSPPKTPPISRRDFLRATGAATGAALMVTTLGTGSLISNAQAQSVKASDIVMLSAVDLARAIREKQVSCREVLTAFLAQIDRFNPRVNAIVSLQDRESLLKQADERDRQLSQGQYLGWMHGFPHAVKDLALTRGIKTTFGSPLFKDFIPPVDAIFVERLRQSGAILIGKTNTPEFGLGSQTYNPVFGTTLNPYDITKTCGGSSGGAAVALALRMVPVADGSDMGGSLRNPAAYCNVLGFRPSAGRVPFGPTAEVFVQQLGYEGPMARTVTDLAMLLAVQSGFDLRAPLSIEQDPAQFTASLKRDFKDVRVAWLANWAGYLPMETGVLELCGSALKAFQPIGCVVEEAKPEFPPERLWSMWLTHRHWLVGCGMSQFYNDPAKRELLKPEARFEVEGSFKLTAMDVYNASVARSAWYAALLKMFARYEYLLIPTAQVFPFDAKTHWPKEIAGRTMDTYHRWMEVVLPWTLSGCPVISIPVGFNSAGLPMGLQIIGKPHGDLAVLQVAYAYEQATGWVSKRLPPMLTG
jgi:amidase